MSRKWILWLCVCLLLVFLFPAGALAIQDDTPPVLKSLQADKTEVEFPGQIAFTAQATDDISGVAAINLSFKSDKGDELGYTIVLRPSEGDTLIGVMDIPSHMAAGVWSVVRAEVEDHNRNVRVYTDTGAHGEKLPKAVSFRVNRSESDVSIRLKSAAISPREVKHGDTAKITVSIDTELTVSWIEANYFFVGEHYAVRLNPGAGGVFEGIINTADLSKYAASYPIGYLTAHVEGGYMHPIPVSDSFVDALALTLSGTEQVGDFPQIVSVSVDKTTAITPGIVTYSIEFSPQHHDMALTQFDVHMISEEYKDRPFDPKARMGGWSTGVQYDKASGKYVGRVILNPSQKPCYLVMVDAYLTRKDGAVMAYTTDASRAHYGHGDNIRVLPSPPMVKVVPGVQGDVNTGTKVDYVDKILNAADGSVIAIDCSGRSFVNAEAFDAIRGTGKTILLEIGGIQWHFKGADIVNPSVGIDTRVHVSTLRDPNNVQAMALKEMTGENAALQIQFPPNGLLPGKATVKIKADYTFQQYIGIKDLYLYYYDPNSCELDFIREKLEMSPDGYYVFDITHNSVYILSAGKAAPQYVSVKTGGQGDGSGKKVVEEIKKKVGASVDGVEPSPTVTDDVGSSETIVPTITPTPAHSSAEPAVTDDQSLRPVAGAGDDLPAKNASAWIWLSAAILAAGGGVALSIWKRALLLSWIARLKMKILGK